MNCLNVDFTLDDVDTHMTVGECLENLIEAMTINDDAYRDDYWDEIVIAMKAGHLKHMLKHFLEQMSEVDYFKDRMLSNESNEIFFGTKNQLNSLTIVK